MDMAGGPAKNKRSSLLQAFEKSRHKKVVKHSASTIIKIIICVKWCLHYGINRSKLGLFKHRIYYFVIQNALA